MKQQLYWPKEPHSVGFLLTSDQPDAETCTWQHTTLTRDRRLCLWRDSNPQSQQTNSQDPCLSPRCHWDRQYVLLPLWNRQVYRKSIYCKTQFTSRQHKNNINYNSISINTQLICYMFRLFLSQHQAYTSRTTAFQFCLTVFELLHWGIPFALQIIIIVCMVRTTVGT